MGIVPMIWALWGASFLLMLVVTIVGARLTRNEEAQIFLAESSNHVKSEQDAIQERMNKIRPFKLTSLGVLGAMTVIVAGYYALDVLRQFVR